MVNVHFILCLVFNNMILEMIGERARHSCRSSIENAICIYLIALMPRNIASQLQYISTSAAGTSAISVTDE